jgi:hypothetical protein
LLSKPCEAQKVDEREDDDGHEVDREGDGIEDVQTWELVVVLLDENGDDA